jgi:hypothetical protein
MQVGRAAVIGLLLAGCAGDRVAPPPISGGTLLVLRDGRTAVAADPDRDAVWIVDLRGEALRARVVLRPGDEPGRVAEDAAGRVHVLLRRGGAVVTLDAAKGAVLARRPVCAAPRGLAAEARAERIHVACAEGWLLTLGAAPDAGVLRRVDLGSDLRDVVVSGETLLVSRFRAAEVLAIGPDGKRIGRALLPAVGEGEGRLEPAVAWRMAALPGGGAVVVHQRARAGPIGTGPGAYAAGDDRCRSG